MNGYQINFYTLQNREYEHQPIADWLVEQAQHLKIRGATVIHGAESFGRDGRLHSARFFEQAEQPIIVVMVVSAEEADAIINVVRQAGIKMFYTRTPVEFGIIGD